MIFFSPGDRITTPTHRTGVILPPKWHMPCHQLVMLDGHDSPIWLLTSILTLDARAQPEPQPAAEPSPVTVTQIAQLNLFEDAA